MNENLKDAAHVGVIGGIGMASHQLTNMALAKYKIPMVGKLAAGAALGAGIIGDLAAVKINKRIGSKPSQPLAKQANVYLEKIAQLKLYNTEYK